MTSDDLSQSQETLRDPVEIPQERAITIQDALLLAAEESFPIGKSTIQRWAKRWTDLGAGSPVKSVLVTTRDGASYRLDRDDFTSWLIAEKNNTRSGNGLRDPVKSQETLRDPARFHRASRDPERPFETSQDASETFSGGSDQVAKLRSENMNLKIDVEVRKQLLDKAAEEIARQRERIEVLLVDKGALQSQILQLGQSAATRPVPHEYRSTTEHLEVQGTETSNSEHVDNKPS